MIGVGKNTVLSLACVAGLLGCAEGRAAMAGGHFLGVQSQPNAAKDHGPAAKGQNHPHPKRRMGDWLREHKDLPLDQQEKLLESDPNFKKLSADHQAALKERLRKFNSLSPEQRERALQRMEFMSRLTQDQRKELRDASRKMQTLPPERRILIHKELRHLREMDPHQRAQTLQSDQFRSTFSPQEQSILQQLSSMTPPGQSRGPATSPAPQPK